MLLWLMFSPFVSHSARATPAAGRRVDQAVFDAVHVCSAPDTLWESQSV
jgi:hypothetical protein